MSPSAGDTMNEPRGIEERISWFLNNSPVSAGMCAQHTWHSLGGDYGCPPAWGASDANEACQKVRASGRYWTPNTWDGPPPRGAWVGYEYGANGHACLSLGDGTIATTDPEGDSGGVGIEDLNYPNKWGASGWDIFTDEYNGVRFEIGAPEMGFDYDYLDKGEGTLTVGRSYVELDKSEWDPPNAGLEHTLVYLNVRPTFAGGKTRGALRIRLIRADGDASAYHDYPIDADMLEDGTQLITHTYFELGDGKRTHIELRCQGGLESADIGTRYTKKAVVLD